MLLSPEIVTASHPQKRTLTEVDAVEVWISRWLRHRRADIVRRFGCDPRRVYEIWEGKRYPASRERALSEFKSRYPELLDRVDFGNHRRIPRLTSNDPAQLALFD
ncbi:MAG: hypothetical protein AAFR75_12075 [Pseudomonadota bacterium]